jgi:WhiB family transcriptional regulator, redox-sensing transcriptional regulator
VNDWRLRANCRGMDPDLFFPLSRTAPIDPRVKAACRDCVVMRDCHDDAERRQEAWGIRAGINRELLPWRRRAVQRSRGKVPA